MRPTDSDDLVRRLHAVELALAGARDDLETLTAVLPLLVLQRPDLVVLHRVLPHPDSDPGAPLELVPVARWCPLDAAATPTQGPPEPLPEPTAPPPGPTRKVLPLCHHGRCHGQLSLHWHAPRTAADNPDLDQLLATSLVAALAERDALTAHTHAMTTLATILRVSARVTAARDPDALLAALLAEAPGPAVQAKLLTVTCDAAGAPVSITVIAEHGHDPRLPATLGKPVIVADSAVSPLWLTNPATAICLEDMRDHPHPGAREGHRRSGLIAAVLIPVRWQGRWLGLVQLGWDHARRYPASERRLYNDLAPHLAAMLDNRLLARHCEQAIADQRRQARTLEIVLDHLPVGVQIHDAATGTSRLNRAATELLRAHLPETVRPLPLYHPDSDERVSSDERLSRMAIASGQKVSRQRDLMAEDGTRQRLSVTAAPVRDEHQRTVAAVTIFHDISARIADERARGELRTAILAAQRAALRERSTPLIPISDELLVLPLIGAIDPERGRQIVDTLAELRGHPHARVILIDLTGVRDLDDAGARAILAGARTLRLRGARAILTGIGDRLAWTLANRDLDLRGLATHATLQSGLAHAL